MAQMGPQMGGILATTASILWSIFLLLVAKNELHLIVWIEQDKLLYPSESTWKEALPLSFQNSTATSVRLLSVKVSNYGKTLIGKQDALWNLSLEAPTSSHLTAFGKPKVSPEATVIRILPGAQPNTLTLELGALEPRASIDLHLMLVNTADKPRSPLEIQPSLVGLPHERVLRSPAERLFERLALAIILSTFLLILVFDGPREYNEAYQHETGSKFVWSLIGRLLKMLVLAIIGGGFLARGLAYVVSWFL